MDSFFFQLSKLAWHFISPDALILFILVFSLILLWKKAYKNATRMMSILASLLLIIAVFPVGDWLLYPLEKRFLPLKNLPASIDGIIVLGGAESIYRSSFWQQVELTQASERFFSFIHLIKKFPDAKKVYTGGSGNPFFQQYKGAQIAKKLSEEQGLDISRIIFESESRNTYENAVFTKNLISPKPGEHWILITSAAHMPRSVGIFAKIEWKVIPYSVDHETYPKNLFRVTWNFSGNLVKLNTALKEWTGLAAYYLAGKTSHFFPKPSDL